MDTREGKKLHDTLSFVGLRAQATAVGLLQLSIELIKVGVLDEAAVTRIKQAIFNDIALSRPSSQAKDEYEATLHRRLDDLFTAKEASASLVEGQHGHDAPS
jgi:hypothetical protein